MINKLCVFWDRKRKMASTSAGYNFKNILPVPNGADLVDIVLSKTQRQTPTQIHPQMKISRIRDFYMRKVKFCQTEFNERFTAMINGFPQLHEIHGFYSTLCNILFNQDHFKLALGQINNCRQSIDRFAKDYVRLLKYADSPYKCKMLKRAALGRMCTSAKKLDQALQYLEEVRQKLGRMPSIAPNTRSLVLSGFPNVGKSSFMNCVTKADVEVQPYAFTTRSLYVGHFDYDYLRWQVIDTPGILDREMPKRNQIEMLAITALAHIQATVMFFVDISGSSEHTIEQQYQLFESIKELFRNKPIVIVCNKTDLRPLTDLLDSEKAMLAKMQESTSDQPVEVVEISCLQKQGVDDAKNTACKLLLNHRLRRKLAATSKSEEDLLGKLRVTAPEVHPGRQPFIPESVKAKMEKKDDGNDELEEKRTIKDLQEDMGGAGVYNIDENQKFILDNPDWKYDAIPEIFNGKNISDFVDADILSKLQALEEEEALLLATGDNDFDLSIWKEVDAKHLLVTKKLALARFKRKLHGKSRNNANLPRHGMPHSEAETKLEKEGFKVAESFKDRASVRKNVMEMRKKRNAMKAIDMKDLTYNAIESGNMDEGEKGTEEKRELTEDERLVIAKKRLERFTNPYYQGRLTPAGDGSGQVLTRSLKPTRIELSMSSQKQIMKATKLKRQGEKKRNKEGRRGEADRQIVTLKPKHLFTGKRSIGKTQWR
eukprot:GHVP01050338.1.p1 GENE.GHVP01050338.1~~GHVP01050338.1.p1  ORF type:complete len:713 (-),score=129.68 GHVP01050338.1:47-2185(-)